MRLQNKMAPQTDNEEKKQNKFCNNKLISKQIYNFVLYIIIILEMSISEYDQTA